MAIVAAYNCNALLGDGTLPDMAGYSRHLTLDPGVALTAGVTGKALLAVAGGASRAYAAGDYIGNGASFSCFARVKSQSSTAGVRVIAENLRGSDRRQSFLLSDASGNLAARITVGGIGNDVTYSSGVNVLDGAWHRVGVAYDALGTGDVTFWVDGTVVATVNRGAGAASEQNGVFAVGRGTGGVTDRRAQAAIEDVRWFNDPVYTSEAALFDAAVQNLVVGAYSYDETGAVVRDYTLKGNDLTLTASGSRVAGVHGQALESVGGHGAEGDVAFWTGGTFDRLTVCGWARITTPGGAAPFFSLETAAGVPKLQLFRGGAGALLMKVWGDTPTAPFDGNYLFTEDGALSTTEDRFIFANVNPTGWELRVYSAAGAVLVTTGGGTGNPPTNQPILSGITKMRQGGGVVRLDDSRVIRNYLNGQAVQALRAEAVTQEPTGTVSNLFYESGALSALYWESTPLDRLYLGTGLLYQADA
ncbi:LamG-like jellyroll fold domain-containing protein [Isoptericola sp. NPDC056605]|uniref:LamG-like jellyroll fold domain-containing protein n=1 Tax=Isoptericola sp. NPDC056605 TaxID=3345876 RepID=UPI0036BEDCAC